MAKGPAGSLAAARARTQALLGWRLMETEEPPAHLAAALGDIAAALGRPGVAAAFVARRSAPAALRVQPWPREVALPPGALHYVLELPAPRAGPEEPGRRRGAPAEPPIPVHLLLVPDGSRSWIALGGDPASLARRLAGAQGAPRVARADLEGLDRGAVAFFDVRSLPEAAVQISTLAGEPSLEALAMLDAVAALPHKGATPVVASLTAQPASSALLTLHVPRAAIEDAVVLGLSHASP